MGNYRNIEIGFWDDPKVEEFTPEDKYFYLYLLTNPHTNICGCYEVGMKSMRNETGYSEDTVLKLLKNLEEIHDVIRYNKSTREVLILNWHKYNWSSSEKLLKAVRGVAAHIKSDAFREYILLKAETGADNRTQITEHRYSTQIQNTDTDTDVSIGYKYPKDTLSKKDDYFPEDELLNEAFKDYVKMRKQIKAPMTDRAIQLAIGNLNKMTNDNDEKIEILNQSIVNSWKGLFPLKHEQAKKTDDFFEKWSEA